MGLNLGYWMFLWMILEVMNWLLMYYIKSTQIMLMFILWQSLASIFMLYSLIILKNKILLYLMFLYKASLPPFHMWFWSIFKKWSWLSFLIFMMPHKYLTLFVLINYSNQSLVEWFIIMPLIIFLNFWYTVNFKFLIWCMVLSDTSWLFFAVYSNMYVYAYLITNLIIMLLLMVMKFYNSMSSSFLLLFMMGLPPFSMFQIKFIILKEMFLMKFIFFLFMNLFLIFFVWFWMFLKSVFNLSLNLEPTKSFILLNSLWFLFI